MRRTSIEVLSATLLLALMGALIFRNRIERASAQDSERMTWGATDPDWSPDGSRLAFSLFGSIWQVSSEGGPAKQITSSAGYHAHPVWSPQGDKIAFVRGDAPAGPIPNIPGRLVIVDLATGQERELSTPNPVAGTPAWSPDGNRLVCGLRIPDAGCLLHEIDVADGKTRQIQFRLQRS